VRTFRNFRGIPDGYAKRFFPLNRQVTGRAVCYFLLFPVFRPETPPTIVSRETFVDAVFHGAFGGV
jgi:hypothetical protein